MRGFVGAIQVGGLWPTRPLPKDIGGRACRKPFKIMLRSAINVKYMPQIFINQRGSEPIFQSLAFRSMGLQNSGAISLSHRKSKWLLIGIDYFTKWVEAEPLYNIRDVDPKRFIWRNVISRFGVPHMLISDNVL